MRLSVVLENLEVPHLLPLRQAPQPTSRINLARLSHPLLRARTTTTDRQKHLTLPWDKTAETRQDRASWNNVHPVDGMYVDLPDYREHVGKPLEEPAAQSTATRFVSRKPGSIQQQRADAGASEVVGGGRARRSAADNDHIDGSHDDGL